MTQYSNSRYVTTENRKLNNIITKPITTESWHRLTSISFFISFPHPVSSVWRRKLCLSFYTSIVTHSHMIVNSKPKNLFPFLCFQQNSKKYFVHYNTAQFFKHICEGIREKQCISQEKGRERKIFCPFLSIFLSIWMNNAFGTLLNGFSRSLPLRLAPSLPKR